MQDELRITFFVIGIVFIVGILVHGAWTIRKNKKHNSPNSFQAGRGYEPRFDKQKNDNADELVNDEDDIYDDVGVSQARVISTAKVSQWEPKIAPKVSGADPHGADQDANLNSPIFDSNSELSDTLDSPVATIVDEAGDKDIDDLVPVHTSPLHTSESVQQVASQMTSNKNDTAPLYSGVVTQPKPEFNRPNKTQESASDSDIIPDPPEFLLKKSEVSASVSDAQATEQKKDDEPPLKQEEVSDFSLNVQEGPTKPEPVLNAQKPAGVEKELSFAEQAKRFVTRRKKTVAEKIRKEPVVKGSGKKSDDQMRIDFESSTQPDPALVTVSSEHSEQISSAVTQDKSPAPDSDVLVLNVRANAENPIGGAALLPMLLTLGFKFGEHEIFHRHVNTNGKGPILFSLTNMFKPGVFDIDNIENFTTQGVSLFMMLPIEGEAQQVFNMMHNAARKIAEEFDCKVLDGNKVLLSKQSLQQYSERIREFERSRFSR